MDNFVTLPLQQKLPEYAETIALKAIQSTGQALPCQVTAVNGSLVTVAIEAVGPWTFPLLTVPKEEAQWMRSPTQIGDVGIVRPASTFLGGISGQGSGTANLNTSYGNLSNLVWVPVAATTFSTTPDPNKPFINGPNGVMLAASDLSVPIELDKTIGIAAIGNRASALNLADRAAAANGDLDSLINDATNGVIAKTLQTLATAIGAAAVTAAIPNAAAFSAILSASGWVKGLSGIEPTIPSCSSIVRLAE